MLNEELSSHYSESYIDNDIPTIVNDLHIPIIERERIEDLSYALQYSPKIELQITNGTRVVGIREGDETVLYPESMSPYISATEPPPLRENGDVIEDETPQPDITTLYEETLKHPDMFEDVMRDLGDTYTNACVHAKIPLEKAIPTLNSILSTFRNLPNLRTSSDPKDQEEFKRLSGVFVKFAVHMKNVRNATAVVRESALSANDW